MKEQIRAQILIGKLEMPTIEGLESVATPTEIKEVKAMFKAAWRAYLMKGAKTPISMPYWAKRINNAKLHNQVLAILSKAEWITVNTKPNSNWSEAWLNEAKLLKYVSIQELAGVRRYYKFNNYKLELHSTTDNGANKTSIKGKIQNTGLVRNGFAKTAATEFKFDTTAMSNYKEIVVDAVTKGINKMIVKYPKITQDFANYREASTEIVDYYISNESTYNSGPRTSDPRGRNNAGYLSKVGNPVGFKVMRSLLIIPEEYRNVATETGLKNKFLFIAQLLGFKSGIEEEKLAMGQQAYLDTQYHDTAYSEDTAEEWFENIWLERLYADIDGYYSKYPLVRSIIKQRKLSIDHRLAQLEECRQDYRWSVPIEIDMSASVLGYLGLLLNHKPFLDRCNITNGPLTDAWAHPVITNRKQFKTIMRQCYGSQMTAAEMWNDMDIKYTAEEVEAFEQEMLDGDIAVAIAFKDFVINNCSMQPEMELHIGNEKFKTYCNRFHNVGEHTYVFDLFDSFTNRVRVIHNTETRQVPDLKSFRRYSVTALIHNLDSQVMNNTAEAVMNKYGWMIDIHDAAIVCCEAADYTREVYCNGKTADEPSLKWVYDNRNVILTNYFASIGITAAASKEWAAVKQLVQPLETKLEINPMVLK